MTTIVSSDARSQLEELSKSDLNCAIQALHTLAETKLDALVRRSRRLPNASRATPNGSVYVLRSGPVRLVYVVDIAAVANPTAMVLAVLLRSEAGRSADASSDDSARQKDSASIASNGFAAPARAGRRLGAVAAAAAFLIMLILAARQPASIYIGQILRGPAALTLVSPPDNGTMQSNSSFEWHDIGATDYTLIVRTPAAPTPTLVRHTAHAWYYLNSGDAALLRARTVYDWHVETTLSSTKVASPTRRFTIVPAVPKQSRRHFSDTARSALEVRIRTGSLVDRVRVRRDLQIAALKRGYGADDQIWLLKCLGDVSLFLDDPSNAAEYYANAQKVALEAGLAISAMYARILNNYAYANQDLGRLNEALVAYRLAVDLPYPESTTDAKRARSTTLLDFGTLLRQLGAPFEARKLYVRALQIDRKLGVPSRIAQDETDLANLETDEFKEPGNAMPLLRDALRVYRQGREEEGLESLADTLDSLGIAYRDLGEPRTAAPYIAEAYALDMRSGRDEKRVISSTHLAEIYGRDLGDARRARFWYGIALAILAKRSDVSPDEAWRTYDSLGDFEMRAGKFVDAERHFKNAVNKIEGIRQTLKEAQSRRLFSGDRTSPYYHLAALARRRGRPADTLGWIERGRAASFRQLRPTRYIVDGPVVAQRIQLGLQNGEAALEYLVGDSNDPTLAVLITRTRLTAYELGNRHSLDRSATELLRTIAGPASRDTVRRSLQTASRAVIPEAINNELVHAHLNRLILAPDGLLETIPFDSLTLRSHDREWPLLQHTAVTIVPSLSWWARMRTAPPSNPAPFDALIVAAATSIRCPTEGLLRELGFSSAQPLSEARSEARDVAGYASQGSRVLLDDAAGFDSIVRSGRLRDFKLLHFATHGVSAGSLASSVLLIGCGPPTRTLTGPQILEQPLRASLVVLSACESAKGRPISGEGSDSLAYAFLLAGAHSVVATRWSVSDSDSATLVKAFYRHLAVGRPVDEALRRAKAEVGTNSPLVDVMAFVALGFGAETVPLSPTLVRRVQLAIEDRAPIIACVALICCVVLFVVVRQRFSETRS